MYLFSFPIKPTGITPDKIWPVPDRVTVQPGGFLTGNSASFPVGNCCGPKHDIDYLADFAFSARSVKERFRFRKSGISPKEDSKYAGFCNRLAGRLNGYSSFSL